MMLPTELPVDGLNRAVAGSSGGRCHSDCGVAGSRPAGSQSRRRRKRSGAAPLPECVRCAPSRPGARTSRRCRRCRGGRDDAVELGARYGSSGRTARPDRGGTRPPGPSRSRAGSRTVRVGDRRSAAATLRWRSSPPTSHAPTRTASTNGSGSSPHMRVSSFTFDACAPTIAGRGRTSRASRKSIPDRTPAGRRGNRRERTEIAEIRTLGHLGSP